MIVLTEDRGPWYDRMKDAGKHLAQRWRQSFPTEPEGLLVPSAGPVVEAIRWFTRDVVMGHGRSTTVPEPLASFEGDTIECEGEELIHAQLRLAQTGCPTFDLTHGLEASLLLTDTDRVRASEVVWPFESFVVALTGTNLWMHDLQGNEKPVRWILVHRLDAVTAETAPRINPLVEALPHLWHSSYWPRFRESFRDAPLRPSLLIRAITEDGVGVFRRHKMPEGNDPLAAWGRLRHGQKASPRTTDLDNHAIVSAYRIVSGLAIYLQQLKAEGRWSPAGRVSKKAPVGEPPSRRWQVGAEIKLPREVREAAKAFARRGTDRAAWVARSRWLVRGTVKNTPFGPRENGKWRPENRRLVTIAPYWKGPQDGVALERKYAVDLRLQK